MGENLFKLIKKMMTSSIRLRFGVEGNFRLLISYHSSKA